MVSREGTGSVVQAGKEFKILASNDLKEKVYASPVIVDSRLYLPLRGSICTASGRSRFYSRSDSGS